jgi:hypothetical protein
MRTVLLGILALSGSSCRLAPHRIPDLATLMTVPSDGTPWRLQVHNGGIESVAIGVPRHTVPAAATKKAQSLLPEASPTSWSHEWGPQGTGYRLGFLRQSPGEEQHWLLLNPAGDVLEYRRSVALRAVPAAILSAALAIGPQIDDAQVRTTSPSTHVWHCTVTDAQGHRFAVAINQDGRLLSRHQIVQAEVHWRAQISPTDQLATER